MITLLAKLLKILNSDANPSQIALAVVLAAAMGLTPLSAPHNIFLLLLVLVLRVNLSMFLLGLAVFSAIGYLIDPLCHFIGMALLQMDSLQSLWQSMYNNSFWRILAFNNTLVLGSATLAALLSLPLFFVARWIVVNYREHILEWVQKNRLMAFLKGGKLYNAYRSLSQ